MESTEDFVVINDDVDKYHKESYDQLNVLIDVFTKAVDTLNHTSILLKDEIQTALSVTLQSIPPEHALNIDELVNKLDTVVISPEEVRKNYVKRVLSRLVAVNEEKRSITEELVSLKDEFELKTAELQDWKSLINPLKMIQSDIQRMECTLLNNSIHPAEEAVELSDVSKVDEVHDYIINIHKKFQSLHAHVDEFVSKQENNQSTSTNIASQTNLISTEVNLTELVRQEVACLFNKDPMISSLRSEQSSLSQFCLNEFSTLPKPQVANHNPFSNKKYSMLSANYGDVILNNINPTTSVSQSQIPIDLSQDLQIAPQSHINSGNNQPECEVQAEWESLPTFSTSDERPWCPACHIIMDSRAELESHFEDCLQ